MKITSEAELFLSQNRLFITQKEIDFKGLHRGPWQEFARTWDSLEMDMYLKDGGTYRLRRYGVVSYDGSTDSYEAHPEQSDFFQSTAHNPINGGVVRKFSPIAKETLLHPSLISLIQHFASFLPDPSCAWKVGIHMIRIVASPLQCGKPAPEGVHRDGHRYVAQVMIQRENISGGESSLFSTDGQLLFTTTLKNVLDSILLDDTRLLHGVSPIQVASGEGVGIRDMLLLDYNQSDVCRGCTRSCQNAAGCGSEPRPRF